MPAERLQVILEMITGQYKREARSAVTSTREIGDAAQETTKKTSAIGGSFKQLGTIVGGAAVAGVVADFFRDSIQQASDLEQAVGGVETVFGDASGVILDYAQDAAQAVGLSESAFSTISTRLGGMLQNLGFDADEAAERTIGLIEIGSDLSATYGGSVVQAMDAVGAALRGETDPIEKYAVNVKQADVNARALALGLADSVGDIDKNAKAVATLDLITEQAAKTTGQFAREQDTAAGRTARLQAEYENVQAEVGQKLLPTYAALLEAGEELLPILETVADLIAEGAENVGFILGPLTDLIGLINGLGELEGPVGGLFNTIGDGVGAAINPLGFFRDAWKSAFGDVPVDIEAAEAAVGSADQRFREAGQAIEDAGGAAGETSGELEGLESTTYDVAEAAVAARDAQRQLRLEYLEAADPIFAASQAVGRYQDAQQRLTELQQDGDATARDIAEAQLAVAEAALEAEAAMINFAENPEAGIRTLSDALNITREDAIELLEQLDVLDGTTVNTFVNTTITERVVRSSGVVAGTGALGGDRHGGGPVEAGKLYQVGEFNQPELYMIPGNQGRIFSHAETQKLLTALSSPGQGTQKSTHINLYGDIPAPEVVTEIQRAAGLVSMIDLAEVNP